MRIVILGAGPTGLGAAWRLHELGHTDWELWEASDGPGGLSRSFRDEHGFTWDLGGHVLFSHYGRFDAVTDQVLSRAEWLLHDRESWIRILDTWVPYPFQYNIHRLPPDERLACLQGLLAAAAAAGAGGPPPANFREHALRAFGPGIADLFLLPYNWKVWACPPEELGVGWIGERVARPDLARVAESIVHGRDNVLWGPNNRFRFPRHGGTGALWNAVAAALPAERIHYGRRAVAVDPAAFTVRAADGATASTACTQTTVCTTYDALISTLPLTELVTMVGEGARVREGASMHAAGAHAARAGLGDLQEMLPLLRHSSVHCVGVALRGQPGPEVQGKCWMYFPEDTAPFFRVTVFSNYSPGNVPDPAATWSLIAEISESPAKPVDAADVARATVEGMVATGLIASADDVLHTWVRRVEHGYPTPTLDRDRALRAILPALERRRIYSRGRFGAWVYEVGNQDHSFMQGVEAVHHILHGSPEITLWFPHLVNQPHPAYGRDWL
jgi:protoporphyrinogen oxidase